MCGHLKDNSDPEVEYAKPDVFRNAGESARLSALK